MTYQKPAQLFPANEAERLKKLESYEILDTPAENSFDKIAVLAAQIFESPIAQVTFVDNDRTFFKSNISPLEGTEIPRFDSFCSLAILEKQVTVFENMLEIPDLTHNKFVEMENGVRFYAGAPLTTREGYQLGTICVLDIKPRVPTAHQIKMLDTLSKIVIDELELRAAARKAVRIQTDMINRIVHDLKNPNTTIKLSAELIRMKTGDPQIVTELSNRITSSANAVLNNLNELLKASQVDEGQFSLDITEVSVNDALDTMQRNFELVAANKMQAIHLDVEPGMTVSADRSRLIELFENLLSNALKYSEPGSNVYVTAVKDEDNVLISFRDEGLGMNENDMGKLFTKFARLSAVPTGREYSNGLGLFLVKTMAELHKGKVWAESPGKNQGSTFFVSLPLAVTF